MAREIEVQTDSQLVAKQFSGEFEILSPSMKRYSQKLKKVAESFEKFSIVKIDRTINGKADALTKLATASRAVDLRSIVLLGRDRTILEDTVLKMLNVEEGNALEGWQFEITNWLANGMLPSDRAKARTIQNRSLRFYLEGGILYKRGFKGPDLRCINSEEAANVMQEIHEGSCGNHSGGRALADKILRLRI